MTNPRDLFGSGGGGGNFPKIEELNGKLVLLKPSLVETVPRPAEFGGGTQERITADVIVFGSDGKVADEYEDMYFSQVGIVNPCKRALKPGAKPFVLGVVARVPSKIGKEQGFDTPEKVEKGLTEHFGSNGKKPKPNFAWGLTDFTDEQGEVAKAYVLSKSPVASGAEA